MNITTIRTRSIIIGCAVAVCLGTAQIARAQLVLPGRTALPSIADQPAATLLLPYFEVDLANPAGANTLFSVNNASAAAALVHVTVWSTMHVSVFAFDMYLTGYDVQTVNMRDVINGVLPVTASAGQDDPDDGISNQGPFSDDIDFMSCNGLLPPPPTPQAIVDHIRASLTGAGSALRGGQCASIPDGTQIARGYVTVDNVNACSPDPADPAFPGDPGYFGTIASDANTLWGDYVYTRNLPALESSDGSPLVHIRASATDPETSVAGQYTFYGRVVGWTAADHREPLAVAFLARFSSAGTFGETDLTVWRDSKVNQSYFNCGSAPAWFPLDEQQILFFDEEENAEVIVAPPFPPAPPDPERTIPAGAQRLTIGGSDLPTTMTTGWLFLNLMTAVDGSPNPPEDPSALTTQAWVTVHQRAPGARYSVGWPALMYISAKCAKPGPGPC
jgi:hypothetical protein